MSVASSASQSRTTLEHSSLASVRSRVADYLELCRPRIAVMTMVSVAVGFTLASPIVFDFEVLGVALVGIVMLVAASSILNQLLERETDRLMDRTSDRPIASGRLGTFEVLGVSAGLTALGFALLWFRVNPLTSIATLSTLFVYVTGYTLLKKRSALCTSVGAIPGAMPPVLGWLAAGGHIGVEALSLFAIFFVWQFPHFLAIGWIHREDYHRAGLKMLPSFTDKGVLTGLFAVIYAAAFVPVAALPAKVGLSGDVYLVVSVVMAVTYLCCSIRFLLMRSLTRARQLLYFSLICLPVLLIALVVDFLRLTSL